MAVFDEFFASTSARVANNKKSMLLERVASIYRAADMTSRVQDGCRILSKSVGSFRTNKNDWELSANDLERVQQGGQAVACPLLVKLTTELGKSTSAVLVLGALKLVWKAS